MSQFMQSSEAKRLKICGNIAIGKTFEAINGYFTAESFHLLWATSDPPSVLVTTDIRQPRNKALGVNAYVRNIGSCAIRH